MHAGVLLVVCGPRLSTRGVPAVVLTRHARCAGKLPHVQGSTGAPPTAAEQQKDKAKLAGDDEATANGHVEAQPMEGLAAKGATAAERAPTPGVPLLPPTPADRVIDASWVVMVSRPASHAPLLPEAVRSALLLLPRRGFASCG